MFELLNQVLIIIMYIVSVFALLAIVIGGPLWIYFEIKAYLYYKRYGVYRR